MYQSPDFVKVELNIDENFLSYNSCYYGSDKHFIKVGNDCEEELDWTETYTDYPGWQCTFSNMKVE